MTRMDLKNKSPKLQTPITTDSFHSFGRKRYVSQITIKKELFFTPDKPKRNMKCNLSERKETSPIGNISLKDTSNKVLSNRD